MWGLQIDAIDRHIHKLDRQTAARHRAMSPTSDLKPQVDGLFSRKSCAATGRDGGAASATCQSRNGSTAAGGGGAGDSGQIARPVKSWKARKGVHAAIMQLSVLCLEVFHKSWVTSLPWCSSKRDLSNHNRIRNIVRRPCICTMSSCSRLLKFRVEFKTQPARKRLSDVQACFGCMLPCSPCF